MNKLINKYMSCYATEFNSDKESYTNIYLLTIADLISDIK